MAERKAFTLVELLVVIAVIALLIAILAPTLMGAKSLARAAFCLTNLNALNKSVFLYAERNRGYMMVYSHSTHDGQEGKVIQAPANTYKSYICFAGDKLDPSTGLLEGPRGLGLVYAAGLLGPAELFYCPDQQDVRSTIANYERPWGSKVSAGSGFIRMGYMWNPWVRPVDRTWDAGPSNNWTYEDGLRIERHPNEWFLTSDLMDRKKTMSHVLTNSATWNLGFVDGHTESWESKWLYQAFTVSNLDTSGDWAYYNRAIRAMAHVPGWDVKIIK